MLNVNVFWWKKTNCQFNSCSFNNSVVLTVKVLKSLLQHHLLYSGVKVILGTCYKHFKEHTNGYLIKCLNLFKVSGITCSTFTSNFTCTTVLFVVFTYFPFLIHQFSNCQKNSYYINNSLIIMIIYCT